MIRLTLQNNTEKTVELLDAHNDVKQYVKNTVEEID